MATTNIAPVELTTTTTTLTTATKSVATTKINNTAVQSKVILFYTPFFREKPWCYFYSKKDYINTCDCNFDHCEISYDNNDYSKADIVFFHARDMPSISELRDLKSNSKNGQYWMYFVKENPFNIPPTGPLNRLFELAMTYRYNSDFPFPYGRYVNRSQEDKDDYTLDVAKTKSKQIAWMVSHCGTRRDKLAKYFEQHGLTIAVGGGCADQYENKLHCLIRHCTEEMSKYKFYFAAENNLCNQYITEKYWENPFLINAVPIVLGGSNYADPQLAIPGSFINAFDFKTPQKLVEYIKKVDSDDTLYNSYFNRKRHYKLFHEKESGCSYAMCNLCDHLKKGIRFPEVYLITLLMLTQNVDNKSNILINGCTQLYCCKIINFLKNCVKTTRSQKVKNSSPKYLKVTHFKPVFHFYTLEGARRSLFFYTFSGYRNETVAEIGLISFNKVY